MERHNPNLEEFIVNGANRTANRFFYAELEDIDDYLDDVANRINHQDLLIDTSKASLTTSVRLSILSVRLSISKSW